MLREETDAVVTAPPTEVTAAPSATPLIDRPCLEALANARACLETALDHNDAWRALRQLEAREAAGEWLDVMESDLLRDRLTQALAAHPEFMAWQFVDAAMACLDAGEKAGQLPAADAAEWADEPIETEASLTASEQLPPAAAATDIHARASPPLPPPLPGPQHVGAHPTISAMPPSPHGTRILIPPMRALSLRIPTLMPRDLKAQDPATAPATSETQAPSPVPIPVAVPVSAPVAEEDDSTRFDLHAIGIGEAEVRIVPRTPATQRVINTRLPPLPLSDRQSKAPPRASRAPVAKWADNEAGESDDYRPISSALDEAQVTIIATSDQDEARARAERRALGVAPDREAQMRRFLKALSGE